MNDAGTRETQPATGPPEASEQAYHRLGPMGVLKRVIWETTSDRPGPFLSGVAAPGKPGAAHSPCCGERAERARRNS